MSTSTTGIQAERDSFEKAVPAGQRQVCLELLAAAIERCNQHRPRAWAIVHYSRTQAVAALILGQYTVFDVTPGGDFGFVLDSSAKPAPDLGTIKARGGRCVSGVNKGDPKVLWFTASCENAVVLAPLIETAMLEAVESVGLSYSKRRDARTGFRSSHVDDFLGFMRMELQGTNIPDPTP